MTWLIGFGILLVVLLLGMGYEARSARRDAEAYPPPGELIDVGGFRLHLLRSGAGSPVVVFDAGLGDSSLVWSEIQEEVARATRACAYDRAGIAWSEAGPRPRAARRAADELHALLLAAGERPPYILVAHSSGVNTARLFAQDYPDEVGGLVLIEPPIIEEVSPTLLLVLKAARSLVGALSRVGGVRLLGRLSLMKVLFGGSSPPQALAQRAGFLYSPRSVRASKDEVEALPETIRQVNESALPQAWKDWPVCILSAQRGAGPTPALTAALDRLAQLSTKGRVVSVKGTHFVHFEHPDLVVKTIEDVIQELRDV
jgi:pimeloyl-ACP methyl ester carboxylesterase